MLQCEGYFSYLIYNIEISNGENARNWVVNGMLKFHKDPTVNESKIVIFLRQVRWSVGKREGFGRREKKRNGQAEEAEESV